jgi:hypothetical protein
MNLIKKNFSKILRKIFKKSFDRKVFMMGTAHILNIRKNYDSIKRKKIKKTPTYTRARKR